MCLSGRVRLVTQIPTVMVMLGSARNYEQFRMDDSYCRQTAYTALSGEADIINWDGVTTAATGVAVGTAAGALLGAAGGPRGTADGMAVGAFGGYWSALR